MNVEIDDGDFLQLVFLKSVTGSDGDVVEETEAHGFIGGGVVAGRPDQGKGAVHLAADNGIGCLYGAAGGIMTVLIRNIGADVDGVVFAILLMNLVNPIVDKIRPKALGKVV